jgi:hypothetical protein
MSDSSSSSNGPSNAQLKYRRDKDARAAVTQIGTSMPKLNSLNFPKWKKAFLDVAFVYQWSKEVYVPSDDQDNEDPDTEEYCQRLVAWQVIKLSTAKEFAYLTDEVPRGDSGAAWEAISNHFQRKTPQFIRDRTSEFFTLSMASSGLGLKQFANKVREDYNAIRELGGKLDPSQIEGVFINGLISEFNPKMLQLDTLKLSFTELVTALWDYAVKENIGVVNTKQPTNAFMTIVPQKKRTSDQRTTDLPNFCNTFAATGKCPRENCTFEHKPMPLGICYFWKRHGRCRQEDKCPHANTHDPATAAPSSKGTDVNMVGAERKQQRKQRRDRSNSRGNRRADQKHESSDEAFSSGSEGINIFMVDMVDFPPHVSEPWLLNLPSPVRSAT